MEIDQHQGGTFPGADAEGVAAAAGLGEAHRRGFEIAAVEVEEQEPSLEDWR